MKNNRFISKSVLAIIFSGFMVFMNTEANAQSKKQKARVKVAFYNNEGVSQLKLSAKYKKHKKYKPATGLDLNIYNVLENDSLFLISKVKINKEGKAFVNLNKVLNNNQSAYTFKIIHKKSKNFKKVSKTLSIKIAYLNAKLTSTDKKPSITATLTDYDHNPVEGAELKVNLQRYFAPLSIGNKSFFTDNNGTIVVPITRKMPGLNGKLNYEVVLEDNDDYGNIKTVIPTNLGTQITDLSTFDQRTMWSPPSKAPYYDLIIPNLLILFIWGTLFLLMFNLYRISKH